MKFSSDDDFLKNEQQLYMNLQLWDNVSPEPRPIGEIMAERFKNPGNVLSGSSINDDEDTNSTLESINQAEQQFGIQMKSPLVSKDLYKTTGSQYQNLISEDSRIYTHELDEGMKDFNEEKLTKYRKEQIVKNEQKAAMEQRKRDNFKAMESMAWHFNGDEDED